MSRKILFVTALAIFFSPIKGDEISDMLDEGYRRIEDLSNDVSTAINSGHDTISELEEYLQKSVETFTKQGNDAVAASQTNLNATADDCVLQAITGNNAAKVLECIEKAYDNAINSINGDLDKLVNDLTNVQHSGDATISATNTILTLTEAQIPTLLESNKQKIETCVSQTCIDNNLEVISKEYVTLLNNINTEVDKVKSFRTSVSQKFIDTLNSAQTAISKAENTGNNQMKKCL